MPTIEAARLDPSGVDDWVLDNLRPRMKWTRDMVHAAIDKGVLREGNEWELIEGELVQKMGKNSPHVFVTHKMQQKLYSIFGAEYVRTQDPIAVGGETNEPEPDCAAVAYDQRYYLSFGAPPPEDVRLVVEVSDSTFAYDSKRKMRIYARAGVADYWIVDIERRRIVVYRDPQPMDDKYANVNEYGENESIAPLAAPESSVLVRELLP